MAEKNVQIKFRNSEGGYDDIFPKTKEELVEGLSTSLDGKVDKEAGKGLSTEDYTTIEKNKLAGVEVGAEKNVVTKVNDKIGVIVLTGEDIKVGTGVGVTVAQQLEALFNDIINKSDKTHNHTLASLSEKSYNSLTDRPTLGTVASKNTGTSSGQIPILGAGGKLDDLVIPKIAISETSVVDTQAAMLALTAEIGDVCVRTDLSKTYILRAEPASTLANWQELLNPDSPVQSVAGKTGVVTLTKSDVGLGSVSNYGIATQTEAEAGASSAKYMSPLRTKQAIDALQAVKSVAGKTGAVTLAKGDVGLGSVDNTSDANKPVSTATQTALNGKVDKVSGKGLSTEDYTSAEKTKLAGVEAGANNYTHPSTHPASMITESTQKRFVSDEQISTWNTKTKVVISTTEPDDADIWYQEI